VRSDIHSGEAPSVDEGRSPVEEALGNVDDARTSRIPLFFLGIPLAQGPAEAIELLLRDSSGKSGIGRKVKVHTAGQLAAAAG
jgi:hypothetical protein